YPLKIQLLGTAAAEGWPALFCGCDACRRARSAGGKNIRTRSGALIDDVYKIDFGPDTYHHVLTHGLDLGKVEHLIFTHAHSDHLAYLEMENRFAPYAHLSADHAPTLHVWGNQLVLEKISEVIRKVDAQEDRMQLHLLHALTPVALGDATLTPLPADHDPAQQCFIHLFERNGKRLLYGHDTGYFPEETWAFLSRPIRLDMAILDCTFGPEPGDRGHMGLEACVRVKERLLAIGAADSATQFVVTHFSHNGKLLHHEFEEVFNPHGFTVAYDGIVLRA